MSHRLAAALVLAGLVAATAAAPATAATPFSPRFEAEVTSPSPLARNEHPALRTVITQAAEEEPLRRVEVTLPVQIKPEEAAVPRTCPAARLIARTCRPSSRIGAARVQTPLVAGGLSGPVLLAVTGEDPEVQPGIALPYAVVELSGGGLHLRLDGQQRYTPRGRLRTTFSGLPPVPVTRFELSFLGGKQGALRANRALCSAPLGAVEVKFVAQDGRTRIRRTRIAVPACARAPRVRTSWEGFASRPTGRVLVRRGTDGPRLRRVDVTVPRSFLLVSTRRLLVRVDGEAVSRRHWSVSGRRIRVRPPGGRASRVEVRFRSSTLATRGGRLAFGDRREVGVVTPLRMLDGNGRGTTYLLRTNATR